MTSPKNTKYAPQLAIILFDPCVVMASRLSSPNFETRSTPKCRIFIQIWIWVLFQKTRKIISKIMKPPVFLKNVDIMEQPFLVHNFFSRASPNRSEPCTDTAFSWSFRISHQCRWSRKCQKSHFFGGVDYQRYCPFGLRKMIFFCFSELGALLTWTQWYV